MKNQVSIGNVKIGGGAPISVQSMTNTKTEDVNSTLSQIESLYKAGCDIVRVSVYNVEAAEAVKKLVDKSPVPLVADVHFDARLAIKTVENGIHKLRINPGNIQRKEDVALLADCAKMHGIPIRIGVNSGSIPEDVYRAFGGASPKAMVESARRHITLLEECGFYDIVLSIKSSDVENMVKATRLAYDSFPYPLHLGVTESGLPGRGTIKSAIGIGSLLLDGIGDTIRVSLAGSPIPEAKAAMDILKALNLRKGVEHIVCPTCGRTNIDVEKIAREVEQKTEHIDYNVKIAIMGCVVNGPGEAKGADIALCGGKGSAALYVDGKFSRKIEDNYVGELLSTLDIWHKQNEGNNE